MAPIFVLGPIFVTSIKACPEKTVVPIKSSSPSFFSIGTLSPVSIASLEKNLFTSKATPSAGILSPCPSITTSPGTKNFVSISFLSPSLITIVVSDINFFKADKESDVLFSWINPNIVFITTANIIMIASVT